MRAQGSPGSEADGGPGIGAPARLRRLESRLTLPYHEAYLAQVAQPSRCRGGGRSCNRRTPLLSGSP